MATVFFYSACGYTERIQSCTGRRRLNSSFLDNVYKLLESVIANKVAQSNIQLDLGHLMNQATYMCKSCYYAYEYHHKAKAHRCSIKIFHNL